MKFVRKIWRLGLVLAVVLGGLGLFPAAQPAHAENDCESTGNGVFCNSDQSACVNDPCTANQYGQLVKSCTPGESTAKRQVNKLITYGENKQGCAIGRAVVDTCTGVVKQTFYNSTIGEAEMCFRDSSTATLEPVCDTIEIRNGQLSCSSSCFGFNISASVTFPGFCIDVTPYPVTLVNYDTAVRNS